MTTPLAKLLDSPVKRLAAVGAGVVVLLVGTAVVLNSLPGTAGTDAAGAGSPTSSASPAGVDPSGSGTPAAGTDGSSSDGSTGDGSTGNRGTPGQRTTTEVQAPTPSASFALPPSEPRTALVTAPLPASADATGSLVDGFPSAVPTVSGTKITSSSVSSSGSILQAALTGTTSTEPTAVLSFYQDAFAKVGLVGDPADAVGGSTAYTFARGDDTITVTVTPSGSGSRYELFAVLNAGA